MIDIYIYIYIYTYRYIYREREIDIYILKIIKIVSYQLYIKSVKRAIFNSKFIECIM